MLSLPFLYLRLRMGRARAWGRGSLESGFLGLREEGPGAGFQNPRENDLGLEFLGSRRRKLGFRYLCEDGKPQTYILQGGRARFLFLH